MMNYEHLAEIASDELREMRSKHDALKRALEALVAKWNKDADSPGISNPAAGAYGQCADELAEAIRPIQDR